MAYAKASLIQDIRHLLQDNPWETTSTTIDTNTTVAVPDGTKWAIGDIGEWSYTGTVGGEQFLVRSVALNNLTVLRGYNGTTAEAHSSGDRVAKNPTYSVAQMADAIDRIIDTAYPTVWKAVTTTVDPADGSTLWFDSGLTGANATGVIDLVRGDQLYGDADQYPGAYGSPTSYLPSRPIVMVRHLPTSLVSSGIGLRFPGGFFDQTNLVTVTWRAKVTNAVSGGNYSDVDEGLLSEAIAHGVVGRLLGAKEVSNVSESASVDQSHVGAYVGVASWFEQKHREMLEQYNRDLMTRIPPMPDQNYLPGWM